MSFHENTKDLLCSAIDKEYENACQEHGKTYHSLHEGWAVLKEEVEEALWPVEVIKGHFEGLWQGIRYGKPDRLQLSIDKIEESTILAMMELAQVYACCMKLQNTLQGGENG